MRQILNDSVIYKGWISKGILYYPDPEDNQFNPNVAIRINMEVCFISGEFNGPIKFYYNSNEGIASPVFEWRGIK